MKMIDIIKHNRELATVLKGEIYEIAIISNITLNYIKEILELRLRQRKINAVVTLGDYDSIVQDSNKFNKYKAVIVFWEMCNFIDGFQNKYYSMTMDEINLLTERIEDEIGLALNNLSETSLVLVNKFTSNVFADNVLRAEVLTTESNRLNDLLIRSIKPNQIPVNIDKILINVGIRNAVDFRQYQMTKTLYSVEFMEEYVDEVMPAFMSANGYSKKILVLDCDNTLWGGIIGEEGYSGIELGEKTYSGQVFKEVQTIIKGMRKEGVLIALCSKNNQIDVDYVLNNHPSMILKDADFVLKKINWKDKAANIKEIATELNLNLDSFVFIDDSDFEIGLIKKELPEIKSVQVPKNISEYPAIISKVRKEFFTISKSKEDGDKTEKYKQEAFRKEYSFRFSNIEDYLTSLKIKIKIIWNDNIPITRAAQLSQKTNQFNLNTERYTEGDIKRMISSSKYDIAMIDVYDNFGEYGITGMVIFENVEEFYSTSKINIFLMSCRILGRNIEYKFFDELVSIMNKKGINYFLANYKPTNKNIHVAEFYDGLGFDLESIEDGQKYYKLKLCEYVRKSINYIEII